MIGRGRATLEEAVVLDATASEELRTLGCVEPPVPEVPVVEVPRVIETEGVGV